MKRLCYIFIGLLGIYSFGYASELRGLWVSRWAMTSPENIKTIVEKAKQYHFNALFVQVRGEADAYYKSKIDPRAMELANQDPDFDPLQLCIDLAHQQGIQVHAWVNVYPVWSGAKKTQPSSPNHIYRAHPEWLMVDKSGQSMNAKKFYNFISPGIPEVQDYLSRVFQEIIGDYDVDGLHLDHFRFPDKAEVPGEYSYDKPSVARFMKQYGKPPELMPREWHQWQCDQITNFLRRVYYEVNRTKPEIAVSVAVKSNPVWAANDNFQDWTQWLSMGIADFLVPMIYNSGSDNVLQYTQVALHNSGERYIFPGLRAYEFSADAFPISRMVRHIEICRELGAKGIVLFSYDDLTKNNDAGFKALLAGPFKEQAEVTELPWKKK